VSVLISPVELRDLLAAGDRPRLLDVRWSLAAPHGQADYVSGHLPGAVFVDLENELSLRGARSEGRHPLPPVEYLESAARRWGIDDEDTVVVYDDAYGLSAARAWWLLRHAGIADVRILDGGLAAWRSADGPLEAGTPVVPRGTATLRYGHLPVLSPDDAAALPGRGVLVDARARERYLGEAEPVDPRAGHIPGAVNAPTTDNLGPDGRFLSPDALRARFAALGITADAATPVGVYCGSGVTAAHEIAALTLAGIDAALYSGSWSQWSSTEGRPVETDENVLPARAVLAP